jgi:hypothetical protein
MGWTSASPTSSTFLCRETNNPPFTTAGASPASARASPAVTDPATANRGLTPPPPKPKRACFGQTPDDAIWSQALLLCPLPSPWPAKTET